MMKPEAPAAIFALPPFHYFLFHYHFHCHYQADITLFILLLHFHRHIVSIIDEPYATRHAIIFIFIYFYPFDWNE